MGLLNWWRRRKLLGEAIRWYDNTPLTEPEPLPEKRRPGRPKGSKNKAKK